MNGRIKRNVAEERLSFPIIGKIKVGIKTEKGYPKGVDYFVPSGKYSELFKRVYGDKPNTIQIVFISDDAKESCIERYEYRDDKGKLIAFGDGEIFNVWGGQKYSEISIAKYPDIMEIISEKYPNRKAKNDYKGWDVTLKINFLIPLIRGVIGLWSFETKGYLSSIPNIRNVFDEMLCRRGFVKGIIFDMNVKFVTSQKPYDKSVYPIVSIVPNESEDNVNKLKDSFKNNILNK